jgi:hypothetical protein
MATKDEENPNAISSIRYYSLNDDNARTFYDEFRFKTLTIIKMKGWSRPFEYPLEVIPESAPATSATEEAKVMYKANYEGYNQLVMSCSGVPLGIVQRAKGNVRDAITLLDKKYARKDKSNLITLIQEFGACKLESTDEDPDKWFLRLDAINMKLKAINSDYEKKDFELKAHLLGNLPEGYEDVVTKISGNEDKTEVGEIEETISSKWSRDFKKEDENEAPTKGKNVALAMERKPGGFKPKQWTNHKKFKGKCRKCGKQGHKADDCRSNNKVCFECGKEGHFARECPDKKSKDTDTKDTGMFVGMLWCQTATFSPQDSVDTTYMEQKKGYFMNYLMDSGASCHVVPSEDGLVNLRDCDDAVLIGDNSEMKATKEGSLYLETEEKVIVRLDNVKVIPGIAKRIVSVGCLTKNGNKVEIANDQMILRNPTGSKILIEQRPNGTLFYLSARSSPPVKQEAMQVTFAEPKEDDANSRENWILDFPKNLWTEEDHAYIANLQETRERSKESKWTKVEAKSKKPAPKKIDINDAHELYGHVSDGPLKASLLARNYVVVGTKKSCEACAYAKAKAKGVSKTPKKPADIKGERLYLDISGPYKKTVKGSQFWILIVDDKTRKAWSFFVPRKSLIKQVTNDLVKLLKGASVVVKYLRCDNAGENVKGLGEVCTEHGIQLELTAPHTPQTNGVVERKFVTLRDRAQAMMLGARLDDEHQGRLWAEAVYTATRLHNAVPNSINKISPDQMWYGESQRILDHLVTWGRIGFVKDRGSVKKLDAKSTKMVCMGYSADHAGDVYRMYNPETKRIIDTRDVTWGDWHGSQEIPTSLKMFAEHLKVDPKDDQIGEEASYPPPPTSSQTMMMMEPLQEQGGRSRMKVLQQELQQLIRRQD